MTSSTLNDNRIAVVIPCYRVLSHIQEVINSVGPEVGLIYVIDDCCPDHSGDFVRKNCNDPRIQIIHHEENLGVGGAVMTGYHAAIHDGADVIVKIDGDGQMDPSLIPEFVAPILCGKADYTKGNRFFDVEKVRRMPIVRLIGNIGLSFLTKLSSGYWNLFDPTNGYTAISAKVAAQLPFDKINCRYFFESDMLFRLNTLRAVVLDIPMHAVYGDEISNLSASKETLRFLFNNLKNLGKRILYNYFIRNFNYATIEFLLGVGLLIFGFVFGSSSWIALKGQGTLASAGTVMLASLPMIMGLQLALGFVNYDMTNIPSTPIQKTLATLQK